MPYFSSRTEIAQYVVGELHHLKLGWRSTMTIQVVESGGFYVTFATEELLAGTAKKRARTSSKRRTNISQEKP